MTFNSGFIYIRNHESYEKYDAYKLGKTQNIPERVSTYVTSEMKSGTMIRAFEVPYKEMNNIELFLQEEFRDLNIRYNGATEFYNTKIYDLLEPCIKLIFYF